MKNIVKMADLTNEEVFQLIHRGLELKNGKHVECRDDLYVANLFFENSTRTKHSFEIAEHKHKLKVINFEVATSSVNKGETLYDTCKTLEMLGCNMLVIRHSQNAYYDDLKNLNIPILNGGDGSGEHPSQCLLDLMTMYEKFGTFENLNIIIAGDIKNSRVAKSNYRMLTRLGAKVRFVCPDIYKDETLGEVVDFDEVIGEVDVCMLLRVQHERHASKMGLTKEEYHEKFGLTPQRYEKLKETAIVMHPAPVNRDVEIASELVEAPKSVIFEQMKNGMFMRQAMIEKVIKDNQL